MKLFEAISIFCENDTMPLVIAMRQFQYIREIVSVSADAVALKPIAILTLLEL
jgi:hypothetical protein